MKNYLLYVCLLLCYQNTIAQPTGGDLSFYLFDKHGKSLFSHQDSIIYFDNQYENDFYRITVKGKHENYGIYFNNRFKMPNYEIKDNKGVFIVRIFARDSLTIHIINKKRPANKMIIYLPTIEEGSPYIIYTKFRKRRFKITKEQIENAKQKNSFITDLSHLFR